MALFFFISQLLHNRWARRNPPNPRQKLFHNFPLHSPFQSNQRHSICIRSPIELPRQRASLVRLLLLVLFLLSLLSTASSSSSSTPPIDLGTTLVAIKYKHGVVVAADSRTSVSGYVSHRYAHKITPITPHCVICRSGSAADTQQLAQAARVECQGRRYRYGIDTTVSQVAHWVKGLVYNNGGADSLSVGLLVAGYDSGRKEGKIFTVLSSGALLEEPYFAMSGSGSTYIVGFLDNRVRQDTPPSSLLEENDAIELCQQAVELAMNRDGSSGGVVRIYICNADGTRELFTTSSSAAVDNAALSSRPRQSKRLEGFASLPIFDRNAE